MNRASLLLTTCAASSAFAQCEPQWFPVNATPGTVYALAYYSGEVVAAGQFSTIGGQTIHSLAASADHGVTWHPLGGNVGSQLDPETPGIVNALYARSDGLYATGLFSVIGGVAIDNVARWDGTQWHPMDEGFAIGGGADVTEYNGDLVVAGQVFTVGGQPAHHIVRWDGEHWNPFSPTAPSNGVLAICRWGKSLMAAAMDVGFWSTGSFMARWDGAQWNEFASTDQPNITTLAVYNNELYAGQETNGPRMVIRYNGSTWVDTAPLPVPSGTGRRVFKLDVHNGELYAGGSFRDPSGVNASFVAKWTGSSWQKVGTGIAGTVRSMLSVNGELWVGGTVTSAGGQQARGLAYFACSCYANCDASSATPLLTANDFQCFLNQFATGSPYANCDNSTVAPLLTANDFQCFLNKFASGCN